MRRGRLAAGKGLETGERILAGSREHDKGRAMEPPLSRGEPWVLPKDADDALAPLGGAAAAL
jgi:hypothetical protein